MRIRALLCSLAVTTAALSVAACDSQSSPKQADLSAAPSMTATPSVAVPAPTPTETPEEYPALTARDFTVIGYNLVAGSTDKWEVKDSKGSPVLTGKVGDKNVTAFTLDGVTCKVALNSIQATPGRVSLMATVSTMVNGSTTVSAPPRVGTYDYLVGDVTIGTYNCH